MEPITPITETAQKDPIRGTLADMIAAGLSALAALVALGYSIVFFTRFLENDTHIWGIISAFLLCFGVGAFAYGPAAIIARLGWNAHKHGANRRGLIWVLVLLLPWVVFSLLLLFVSDMPRLYSLPILILTALLMIWATVSLLRLKDG